VTSLASRLSDLQFPSAAFRFWRLIFSQPLPGSGLSSARVEFNLSGPVTHLKARSQSCQYVFNLVNIFFKIILRCDPPLIYLCDFRAGVFDHSMGGL
jgi:hypothetical protein